MCASLYTCCGGVRTLLHVHAGDFTVLLEQCVQLLEGHVVFEVAAEYLQALVRWMLRPNEPVRVAQTTPPGLLTL